MSADVNGMGSLSVTDLSVRFGGIHAVQGVSLDAPVGRPYKAPDRPGR